MDTKANSYNKKRLNELAAQHNRLTTLVACLLNEVTGLKKELSDFKVNGGSPSLSTVEQKSASSNNIKMTTNRYSNFNDLKADASIAFNRLEYSQRYKIDKADLKKFIAKNPGTYYGTGHSLGGAILDLFIREGMINEGISFNPAIQSRDYQSDSYLKNKRIYESCDPLYKTMGRFAKGSQANTNAKGNILECHSLSNFDSITGGKKLKHIKKYLKGMGIPATKKNIDHAISACDSEGVAWD